MTLIEKTQIGAAIPSGHKRALESIRAKSGRSMTALLVAGIEEVASQHGVIVDAGIDSQAEIDNRRPVDSEIQKVDSGQAESRRSIGISNAQREIIADEVRTQARSFCHAFRVAAEARTRGNLMTQDLIKFFGNDLGHGELSWQDTIEARDAAHSASVEPTLGKSEEWWHLYKLFCDSKTETGVLPDDALIGELFAIMARHGDRGCIEVALINQLVDRTGKGRSSTSRGIFGCSE